MKGVNRDPYLSLVAVLLEDVLSTIDRLQHQLKLEDDKAIPELSVLFAPTGAFQEISISSGWGEEFLTLAAQFEELVASNASGT